MSCQTNPLATESPPDRRVRLSQWAILAAIVAVGAGLRFHQITKVGLWPDEFWSSIHLATGRGASLLAMPGGVLMGPPPAAWFEGAPSWWHIWTGMGMVTHPPVYLICLRWWIDLFGATDYSVRTFSAIASLAGAVVLFDIMRRTVNANAGLIAAALMAIAPMQINISQEARPYPFLALVGLLACHALFRIEQKGATFWRLFQLGFWCAAAALTHYFALGALLAIFCYGCIRFRGRERRRLILALVASALFVLAAWGPFFWQQRPQYLSPQPWSNGEGGWTTPWIRAAAIPSALLFGRIENPLNWIAPAILAYLLPLVLLRRHPQILLWWLWIAGIVGLPLAYDCIHPGRLLGQLEFVSMASCGFYAICAFPILILKSWRYLVSWLMLGSAAIGAVQRVQEGPPDYNGDWRGLAVALDHDAGPDDPLVFMSSGIWGSPGMYYLDFDHYAHNSHRPIMFLRGPADAAALRQLEAFKKVWLIGPSDVDISNYLPGWVPVTGSSFYDAGRFTEMIQKTSPATSGATSRPGVPAP
jgi:hypothetical protein